MACIWARFRDLRIKRFRDQRTIHFVRHCTAGKSHNGAESGGDYRGTCRDFVNAHLPLFSARYLNIPRMSWPDSRIFEFKLALLVDKNVVQRVTVTIMTSFIFIDSPQDNVQITGADRFISPHTVNDFSRTLDHPKYVDNLNLTQLNISNSQIILPIL